MPMPRNDRADFGEHDEREVERGHRDQGRHHDRRHVAQRDPDRARPHHLRRRDEQALADLQHLGAGGAQINRYAGKRQDQHQVGDPRLEHVEHHHREQQRREAHDDVGQAHDHLAGPAAAVARDQAERAADQHRRGDRGGGHGERILRRDDDPRQNAAAERVGAQHVQPAMLERERRRVALAKVHLGRDVAQQGRPEQRAQHHDHQIDRRDQRELVAHQQREPLLPGPLDRRQGGGRGAAHQSYRMRGSRIA